MDCATISPPSPGHDVEKYSPDHPFGVVFVQHTPRSPAVLAHEGLVIVIHAVSTRAIVAFPPRRIVVIVAGVVGHAVFAVAVAGGTAMNRATVVAVVAIAIADIAAAAAAVAVIASTGGAGGSIGQWHVAGRRHNRWASVQREEVLLQSHAHCVARSRVVTQSQHVEALLSLPDV